MTAPALHCNLTPRTPIYCT